MTVHIPSFSAASFLDDLRAAGVSLRLDPEGRLLVRWGTLTSSPALDAEIKRHREALVRLLQHEATLASAPASPGALGSRFAGLSERIEAKRRAEARMVEARKLIQRVREAGAVIRLSAADRISVSPRPDDATTEALREAKPELLTLLGREQAEATEAAR